MTDDGIYNLTTQKNQLQDCWYLFCPAQTIDPSWTILAVSILPEHSTNSIEVECWIGVIM